VGWGFFVPTKTLRGVEFQPPKNGLLFLVFVFLGAPNFRPDWRIQEGIHSGKLT